MHRRRPALRCIGGTTDGMTEPRAAPNMGQGREPTPVFLISFNRGTMLRRAIAGIRCLARPTEIIIHDNGSTDIGTVRTLRELEESGIKVFRHPPIAVADELNRIDETVRAWFSGRSEPARYVVSDCDIDMSIADSMALDVYDELLDRFRHVECVGPMLRIRDVPKTYPLFNRVMNRHIMQFWRRMPVIEKTSLGDVAILEAPIDTTFAVHRAGASFRRLKNGLRVYEPFEARHLDWYGTDADGDGYRRSSSPSISHWNNAAAFSRFRDVTLDYSEYFAVRRNPAGGLEIYTEHLGDNKNCQTADRPAVPGQSATERD